jgi:tRNA-Thr(GGU) m(6)t(6)A37 methyltransferase TsaA
MPLEIKLNPVGSIEAEEGRFYLSIKKRYRKALKELEGFSHIFIIWWGNQSDSTELRDTLVVNKPYRNSPDTVGIFATRSEIRPNPVLVTAASIIGIDMDRGIVDLSWVDAKKGTPVIDIKPYQPCSDRVKNVKLPDWCSNWPQWYEDSTTFDWTAVFNF